MFLGLFTQRIDANALLRELSKIELISHISFREYSFSEKLRENLIERKQNFVRDLRILEKQDPIAYKELDSRYFLFQLRESVGNYFCRD